MKKYITCSKIKVMVYLVLSLTIMTNKMMAQKELVTDVIKTKKGNIEITFVGHSSLIFKYGGKVIYIDPFSALTDYSLLPKADLILITHHHPDHMDLKAIKPLLKESTIIILTQKCKESADSLSNTIVMKNGDKQKLLNIIVEAFPAYNLVNKRENGEFFHPKGEGNGYILIIDGKRIYIAGDTENTPEMKALKNIDIAFLPMNLPYTMTPEMVADAAKAFKPKILYPYHYGESSTQKLIDLLRNDEEIEIHIQEMK